MADIPLVPTPDATRLSEMIGDSPVGKSTCLWAAVFLGLPLGARATMSLRWCSSKYTFACALPCTATESTLVASVVDATLCTGTEVGFWLEPGEWRGWMVLEWAVVG